MILSIETATEVCGTSLVHQGKCLSQRAVKEKYVHSEKLLTFINDILQEAQVEKASLTGIAVSVGPGSFTGLRIGMSTAKGLCYALGIPLFAVPTLDGIAATYFWNNLQAEQYCAMIIAKKDEVYYNLFKRSDLTSGHRNVKYGTRDDVKAKAEQDAFSVHHIECDPITIAQLAEKYPEQYRIDDYSSLEPMYFREFFSSMPKNIEKEG